MCSPEGVHKGDGLCDVEHEGELHPGDDVVPGGAVRDAVVVRARLLGDHVHNPVPPVGKVPPRTPLPEVHPVLLDDARAPRGDSDENRH